MPERALLLCRPPAASAAFHKSPAVCLAALKFFLGQDAAQGEGGEGDGDEEGAAAAVVAMPSKEEFYKANKQVGHAGLRPLLAAHLGGMLPRPAAVCSTCCGPAS